MRTTTVCEQIQGPAGERVLVRRSARRTRTVAIAREGGDLVVSVPSRMSRAEERRWVTEMIEKLRASEARRSGQGRGDEDLARDAQRLSRAYFEGRARPTEVVWSTRQNKRWGSCTPSTGRIRLSARLRPMPRYVIDYVLVHELAHLFVPGHGPDFEALVGRYPLAEKARGFLEGVTYVDGRGADGFEDADVDGEGPAVDGEDGENPVQEPAP
jgi:predicted metal-dependent hydrolase